MTKRYEDEYQSKLVTAEEAVQIIKSGDWVDYGDFVTNTIELDAALSKRKEDLKFVKIRTCTLTFFPQVVECDPDQEHFICHDWSFSAKSRQLHDQNRCFLLPEAYHEIPAMYRKRLTSDVAFFGVAPMDQFGNFNFGTTCSKNAAIKDVAQKIVVEVNRSIPVCLGGRDESIHISEVDYIVESNNPPLVEIPRAIPTEVDHRIAALLMEEMEDGACLQLGIGGLPNMVGSMIAASDLKDLGVHTELLVDSFVDMVETGRVTNRRKQIDRGKLVYTFAMGTRKLYDFLHHNSNCAIYPVEYTNDPFIIAQNDKVFSLCSGLAVDLLGQVSSESVGFRQISATGGQLDFHYASFRSKGGKGFICMPSTSQKKDGSLVSRIVPSLKPGTTVTVPRSLTNYLATEYGIVNLKGLSTWERTEALISIAHPDFRDELIKQADQNRIWLPSNKRDAR